MAATEEPGDVSQIRVLYLNGREEKRITAM
jgi:ribosomal protein S28E/S33